MLPILGQDSHNAAAHSAMFFQRSTQLLEADWLSTGSRYQIHQRILVRPLTICRRSYPGDREDLQGMSVNFG